MDSLIKSCVTKLPSTLNKTKTLILENHMKIVQTQDNHV